MKVRDEFTFILPNGRGLETENGKKVSGVMKLIRVKDLSAIGQDGKVKTNPGYFYVILLARIVKKLGEEKMVTTKTIENLAPEDFGFLVDMANRVNRQGLKSVTIQCGCGNTFNGEFALSGEA